MARESTTLNLGPLFFVWAALFIVLALITQDPLWVVVALGPFVVVFALAVLMLLVVFAVIGVKYWQGHPVYLTTPRKGTRVVRRSSRPVPYSNTKYSLKFGK